jgi:peroxiredoxin
MSPIYQVLTRILHRKSQSMTSAATDMKQAFLDARDFDGSMSERLGVFADAMRRLSPGAVGTIDRMVDRLKQHQAGENAPKVGDVMPPFMLPDENGHMVALASLLERGPTIVTFHRGHWCPWCRISLNTLARAQSRVVAAGACMVAIVPDREQFAAEMKSDAKAAFPILTDMDNGYAMSLNLAIWVGAEMEQFMTDRGNVLPKFQGNDTWMLPIPATFVVGQDGHIKARFVDPDYRNRMAIEDLIAALK